MKFNNANKLVRKIKTFIFNYKYNKQKSMYLEVYRGKNFALALYWTPEQTYLCKKCPDSNTWERIRQFEKYLPAARAMRSLNAHFGNREITVETATSNIVRWYSAFDKQGIKNE